MVYESSRTNKYIIRNTMVNNKRGLTDTIVSSKSKAELLLSIGKRLQMLEIYKIKKIVPFCDWLFVRYTHMSLTNWIINLFWRLKFLEHKNRRVIFPVNK